MSSSRIQKLTALVQTQYLSLYEAAYTNRKGQSKTWMIASRKNNESLTKQYFHQAAERTDAVMLVPLHVPTGKLVLIKQFRIPLNDYIYELPAGLIDPGESFDSTIGRELKEETGLTLTQVVHIQDKLYLSAGMTEESVALTYCLCEGELANDFLEADEDIEAFLISQEEAAALLKSPERLDIKAYLILQSYVLQGTALWQFKGSC